MGSRDPRPLIQFNGHVSVRLMVCPTDATQQLTDLPCNRQSWRAFVLACSIVQCCCFQAGYVYPNKHVSAKEPVPLSKGKQGGPNRLQANQQGNAQAESF